MSETNTRRGRKLVERPHRLILVGTILLILIGLGAFALLERQDEPPVVRPPQEVNEVLEVYQTVPPDVRFTERSGDTLSLGDLRGDVWVASFIFTRCRGTCPIMTASLKKIQARLDEVDTPVRLVSITVDPENDDPEVLAEYARSYDAGEDWLFLTAPDSVVQALAIDVFNLAIAEGTDPEEPIIHSSRFILVDAAGRIRGYYEGTTDEGLGELLKGIRKLEAERGN